MTQYLGSTATPTKWADAKLVAQGFLVAAAQARRLVTYKELDEAIVAAVGAPMVPQQWGGFLGELVPEFFQRHGVVLSAVLVREAQLTPGPGLLALAADQGWLESGESEAAAVERLQVQLFKKFLTK